MNCDTADFAVSYFDLTRMKTNPDLDSQVLDLINQTNPACHSARRTVECS